VVLLQDLHVNGTSQQALRNSSGITGYRSAEEYFKQSEEEEKKDRAKVRGQHGGEISGRARNVMRMRIPEEAVGKVRKES
jgi:hypothetical protein